MWRAGKANTVHPVWILVLILAVAGSVISLARINAVLERHGYRLPQTRNEPMPGGWEFTVWVSAFALCGFVIFAILITRR